PPCPAGERFLTHGDPLHRKTMVLRQDSWWTSGKSGISNATAAECHTRAAAGRTVRGGIRPDSGIWTGRATVQANVFDSVTAANGCFSVILMVSKSGRATAVLVEGDSA